MLAREIFSSAHATPRNSARNFFEQEIASRCHDWEKAGFAPQLVWRTAGDVDLAGVIEFLPRDAGYLLGQNVPVDGSLLGSVQTHTVDRPKSGGS